MSLGSEISKKRRELRLSQEVFASKLNVARQTVSSWECDIFIPGGATLISIGKLLKCSIDDLVNPPRPLTPDEQTPGSGETAAKPAA
jgi:transcriptional regulator with XRE-family HTH domain